MEVGKDVTVLEGVGIEVGDCACGLGAVGLGCSRDLIEVGSKVFGSAAGVGCEVVKVAATGAVAPTSALSAGPWPLGEVEVVQASEIIRGTRVRLSQ